MTKSISTTLFAALTSTYFLGCQPSDTQYAVPTPTNSSQSTQAIACSVTRTSDTEVLLSCPDGTSQVIKDGADGLDGTNGVDGVDGHDGVNGTNGTDGTNGTNGQDAQGVVIIDPCGAESSIGFDEVLIRLPDRTLIAFFKFDNYEHLTRLSPGHSYVTTDGTQCVFSVASDGTITDAHGGTF